MTNKQIKIFCNIKSLKGNQLNNELAYYLEGLLDAGIKQSYIDKIIDLVNKDFEKSIFGNK